MENLFDDDILLNDDNDVTSVFGDTAVTSLSNLVNDNLNYLKFNSYINNDIYKRHNAYYAYMDSFKGYGQYKNYFDVVTFDVNNPYSISLNIKGLLGEKYHCRHYKNCLLGVILLLNINKFNKICKFHYLLIHIRILMIVIILHLIYFQYLKI